jgi:hypothetical protein
MEPKRVRRHGTDYPGEGVEEVVRLAHAEQANARKLGRTLRNELAARARVTPYEVDMIFELMKRGELADAGRRGWLKIEGDDVSNVHSASCLSELGVLEVKGQGPASRPRLAPMLGDPRVEIVLEEAQVFAQPNNGDASLAGRLVQPTRADAEVRGCLFGSP